MPTVKFYQPFSIAKHNSRIISTMQALPLGYEEVCILILYNTKTFATINLFQQASQQKKGQKSTETEKLYWLYQV